MLFVSFEYTDKDGNNGVSSASITYPQVETFSDLRRIVELLKSTTSHPSIVILFWCRFEQAKENE